MSADKGPEYKDPNEKSMLLLLLNIVVLRLVHDEIGHGDDEDDNDTNNDANPPLVFFVW